MEGRREAGKSPKRDGERKPKERRRRRRDHRPPVPPLPYDWHETYLPGVDGEHRREERRPRRAATRVGLSPVRRQSCRTTRFPNGCIAAGGYHSAVVDEQGQVWTFGLGKLGQLGHGPGMRLLDSKTREMTHDEYHPRSINGFFPEYRGIQVSCGVQHTCVVGEDGVLWTFGAVAAYLGQGQDIRDAMEKVTGCFEPQPALVGNTRVMQVSCGWSHTAFVAEGGVLWTWGTGTEGRLGHGHLKTLTEPKPVACVKHVRFQCVAAGAAHTVAVAVGGAVYTCGRGITTGSGETADRLKMAPVQALDGMTAVACGAGAGHTGVVSEEGDVYVWGWGGHGQLGHGTREDRLLPTALNLAGLPVHRMALGAYHTLLVTTNGELISFGAGGPEPELDSVRELMDNDGVSVKLKGGERGRLCEPASTTVSDSDEDSDEDTGPNIVEDNGDRLLPKIVQGPWKVARYPKVMHVSAGAYHSLLVTESGHLYACGVGAYGRLGLGHVRPTFTPTPVRPLLSRGVLFAPYVSTEPAHVRTEQFVVGKFNTMSLMEYSANFSQAMGAPEPQPQPPQPPLLDAPDNDAAPTEDAPDDAAPPKPAVIVIAEE